MSFVGTRGCLPKKVFSTKAGYGCQKRYEAVLKIPLAVGLNAKECKITISPLRI
jgi:hypothetical protein